MKHPIDPVLTTRDAAAYLATTTGTLANWRCNGRGPDFVRLGSSIRYRLSALDTYIDRNTIRSVA